MRSARKAVLALGVAAVVAITGVAPVAVADDGDVVGPVSEVGDMGSNFNPETGEFSYLQSAPLGDANARATCSFTQRHDLIHFSSTGDGTLSVHGWWVNGDCKATKAVVTTQLQKRNIMGRWVDVGSKGVATVYSGGGSGKRSNSRYTCKGRAEHQFRAWVDVDLVGVADLPNKIYHPEVTHTCN